MATKKPKAAKPADAKTALQEKVAAAKAIFVKNKDKAVNDAKRRLAQKKLKRAQRALGKVTAEEKKKAAAAAKGATTS